MIKYKEQSEEIQKQLRIAYQSVDLLRKFGNKCTLAWFKNIFGDDGDRLWGNFVGSCQRDIYKFQTYLTSEQLGDLYANIHLNDELYIK